MSQQPDEQVREMKYLAIYIPQPFRLGAEYNDRGYEGGRVGPGI
jgi:hypothetical protein